MVDPGRRPIPSAADRLPIGAARPGGLISTALSPEMINGLQAGYGNAAVSRSLQRTLLSLQTDPIDHQRDLAMSDQYLLAGMEGWLAAKKITNGAVDWSAELTRMQAVKQPEPDTLTEASDLDRYDMFLQMLMVEAAKPSEARRSGAAGRQEARGGS